MGRPRPRHRDSSNRRCSRRIRRTRCTGSPSSGSAGRPTHWPGWALAVDENSSNAPPSDLLAPDDVHLVRDESRAGTGASAIIATRIRPGKEADYRDWQRRIADATTRARGFRGSRFEPPIAGVQDDWLVVIRFESDADLRAWMASPVQHGLLKEAEPITESIRIRIVCGGLEAWFGLAGRGALREA